MGDAQHKPNCSAPSLYHVSVTSSLLWADPTQNNASVLTCLYRAAILAWLPLHRYSGSHVPYKCLNRDHAASMPDAAQPVCTFPLRLSRRPRPNPGFDIIVLTFGTCSAVHLRSSSLLIPCLDVHHHTFCIQQLKAVWYQSVQADTEGTVPSSVVKLRDARTEY